MKLELGSTEVILSSKRAVFLCQSRSLVLSDLHLGKSASFRARGLGLPEGTTKDDLEKMSSLIDEFDPQELLIAGDLIHSFDSLSPSITKMFQEWLDSHPKLRVKLTLGNHDKRTPFEFQDLEILTKTSANGIVIAHDPSDLPQFQYGISGHLHPSILLRDRWNGPLKCKGFLIRNGYHLILPSFSDFTGTTPIHLGTKDSFYALSNNKVIEIPRQSLD